MGKIVTFSPLILSVKQVLITSHLFTFQCSLYYTCTSPLLTNRKYLFMGSILNSLMYIYYLI